MHEVRSSGAQGVACSVAAGTLFGATFLVAGAADASPDALFGWRMVVSALVVGLVLASGLARREASTLLSVLRSGGRAVPALLLSSALVGFQMWLFVWAPVHEHALDASLGYLLLPIVLVVLGRVGFRDPVTRGQWWAVGLAALAVGLAAVAAASLSWVALSICLGYALYFAVRRSAGLDLAATFGAELLLLVPPAVVLIGLDDGGLAAGSDPVVLLLGLAGAAAMWTYLAAARRLSMPVFGLLSYLEPVLLFVAALLLGERLSTLDAVTYGVLALALVVLAIDGLDQRRGRVAGRTPAQAHR